MDGSITAEKSTGQEVLNLLSGSPGGSTLKACTDLLLEATKNVLHKDCNSKDVFSYGEEGGDTEFRGQVSQFLSQEYGDQVAKESVMMTSGATHGLHVIMTVLVPNTSPVFIIDPTYFLCIGLIQNDLQRKIVPVASNADGPLMEEFEELIRQHGGMEASNGNGPSNNSTGTNTATGRGRSQRYWAAVYLIPTFNNPTGLSYSPEMCGKLVSLARKYNLLLIAEDVYNLVYFSSQQDAPKRLLTYDLPSDPSYGRGHVLSNSTFSKILAPGIRLGWIEGPQDVIHQLSKSMVSLSGGAFSHYVGKLVSNILKTGRQTEHLNWLRGVYKRNMEAVCNVLDQHGPQDWSYKKPEGGFFVWVEMKAEMDAADFMAFCKKNYGVFCLPGVRTSSTGGYKNFLRFSASYNDEAALCLGTRSICDAYKEYVTVKKLT